MRGSARVDSSTPERIKGGQGDARSEFADPCLTGRAALRNIRQEPTRLLAAARRHGSTPSPSGLLVSIPPGEGMGVATGCGEADERLGTVLKASPPMVGITNLTVGFTGSSKADATMAGPLPLPERPDR